VGGRKTQVRCPYSGGEPPYPCAALQFSKGSPQRPMMQVTSVRAHNACPVTTPSIDYGVLITFAPFRSWLLATPSVSKGPRSTENRIRATGRAYYVRRSGPGSAAERIIWNLFTARPCLRFLDPAPIRKRSRPLVSDLQPLPFCLKLSYDWPHVESHSGGLDCASGQKCACDYLRS